MRYEVRDQFDYVLGIITAESKEDAREKAKKKWKDKKNLRIIKKSFIT